MNGIEIFGGLVAYCVATFIISRKAVQFELNLFRNELKEQKKIIKEELTRQNEISTGELERMDKRLDNNELYTRRIEAQLLHDNKQLRYCEIGGPPGRLVVL
ncbi:MAG: hypothetical protein F6J92_21620 [Symploca sp. SIO1A3]|nr:hypothetical protein [Symploca sp. SIO1A3]